MTQQSRPQADNTANGYGDAGPYSRNQWAEKLYATHTGDENTAGQRAQLRGVVPTFDEMLAVDNPAGETVRVLTGAGFSGGSFIYNSAVVDFVPTTPVAARIDRVVIVENNTNVAYNTGLEFPADLTDYLLAASVPPYSARLAILIGTPGGAATNLVQTTSHWMVKLAEYTISAVPVLTGLTDSREFIDIETIVGAVAADNDAIHDALILGAEVNLGFGANDLGVGIKFRLENAAGTTEDAGQLAIRYTDSTAADETRLELRLKAAGSDNLAAVINAPTAAVADGNARGAGAVDLQQIRSAAAQVASGIGASIVGGSDNIASGLWAHAEGFSTDATGQFSHAEGQFSLASGDNSHASGHSTAASGEAAHSEGELTDASGDHSHAEGWSTTADGEFAHAEGTSTTATGVAAHAEGFTTTATGANSHAEGRTTTASGSWTHAEGSQTIADGITAHAEGYDTTANGDYSHAGGRRSDDNNLDGVFIWADSEDAAFVADNANQFKVRASGGTSLVQNAPAAALTVLKLTQTDQDETFIDFVGTSAVDATKSISTMNTGAGAVDGPLSGANGWTFNSMVKVDVNGAPVWIATYTPV